MANTTADKTPISLDNLARNNERMKEYIQSEIDKIPSSTTAIVTLSAAGWSNNTQTVSSSIVTSDCVVILSPIPDNQDKYSSCGVKCTSQSDGSLVFNCSSTPDVDINVNVVII